MFHLSCLFPNPNFFLTAELKAADVQGERVARSYCGEAGGLERGEEVSEVSEGSFRLR